MTNNNPNYEAGLIIGLIFIFIFAAFTIITKPVYGQAPFEKSYKMENASLVYQEQLEEYFERETEYQKQHLTNSILRLMTVWRNPNNPNQVVYSSTCRHSRFGCENTIRAYASYFVDIANQYENVDPVLLAATAKHESNYNAFARGSRGERGIMQILPSSPISEGVMFIHHPDYRRRCTNVLGHCQEEVIQAATRALVRSFEHCNENMNRALNRYNTGSCQTRGNGYSTHIQEVYRNLIAQL
jgi:hypothetical protein